MLVMVRSWFLRFEVGSSGSKLFLPFEVSSFCLKMVPLVRSWFLWFEIRVASSKLVPLVRS